MCSTGEFGDICISSGTSLAASHVSAAASILWGKDKSVSKEFIRDLLVESANYSKSKDSVFERIRKNPWWHGSFYTNYIASYIYATRLGEALGNRKPLDGVSSPKGLPSSAKKEYKLIDFINNIKATTSDTISTPYSTYNISDRNKIDLNWKG